MPSLNFNPADPVIPPAKLAHIVLRTNNFDQMVEYYLNALGARIVFANPQAAFLAYDEEHHRVAIIDVSNAPQPKTRGLIGLDHVAFTYDSLKDLARAYLGRKAKGIEPEWSVNHGPTTSMYYRDPDGNKIEFQVDNMSLEDAVAFMKSPEFLENPLGMDFDPEAFVKRIENGEDEKDIKTRKNIGKRGMSDFPAKFLE
jgi:catechol-2,3-dioxygenase